jgi:hypothetical protein
MSIIDTTIRKNDDFYNCFIEKFIFLRDCDNLLENKIDLLFNNIIKDLKEKTYNFNIYIKELQKIQKIGNIENIRKNIEFNNKNFNKYIKNIFCLHEDYLNTNNLKYLFISIISEIYNSIYINTYNVETNEIKEIGIKQDIYNNFIDILSSNIHIYIIILLNHEEYLNTKYINVIDIHLEEKNIFLSLISAIKLNTKLYKRKLENNIEINDTCEYIKNKNTKNWTQYLLEFIDIFFNKDNLIGGKKGGLKIKKIKKLRKYI